MRAMDAADFFGSMERLSKVYRKAKKFARETTGLSDPELSILDEITRKPGIRLSTVAEGLSLTAGAASKVAAKLVKKGLVSLRGGTKDAEKIRVTPTKKGRAAKIKASEEVWHSFAQALGGAASVAVAVAGLITTMTSHLDRWLNRSEQEKQKKSKQKSRPRRRKSKSKSKS